MNPTNHKSNVVEVNFHIHKYNSEIVLNFAIFKLAQLCILATIFMQSVRHDLKAIFVYQNGLTLTRHIFIMISYLANVPDKIIYAFTVPNRKLFIDENSGYISENASEIRVTNILKVTATFLLLITTSVSVILKHVESSICDRAMPFAAKPNTLCYAQQ